MLSWSRRVEKISLDLAIYKFNLDLFKDETSSYCSSQGVTFFGPINNSKLSINKN